MLKHAEAEYKSFSNKSEIRTYSDERISRMYPRPGRV